MSDVTALLDRRLGVEITWTIPDGLSSTGRLVPKLGYPAELGGASSQPLRATAMSDAPPSFPRVVDLAPGHMLVWLTLGDYAFDKEAPSLTRLPAGLTDAEIRARAHMDVTFVPELSSSDPGGSTFSFWPDVYVWYRNIPVSSNHYCNVYTFVAGAADYTSDPTPPRASAALVGSITARDYS